MEHELAEDHVRVHGIQLILARPSTSLATVNFDLYFVKYVPDVQPSGLVVKDEVETHVGEDEEPGLEFVRDLVSLSGIEKLPGRDELQCILDDETGQRCAQLRKIRKRTHPTKWSV